VWCGRSGPAVQPLCEPLHQDFASIGVPARVFRRIVIELTGPLCGCLEDSLCWWLTAETVRLHCETCKTELTVPRRNLIVTFQVEEAYPSNRILRSDPIFDTTGKS
jgi:hypothetical protein